MRVLVLGANGQVGHELYRLLVPLAEVCATTRSGILPGGNACTALALDQPEALDALLDAWRPEVIFNAAAYTAVDRAESDPEAAHALNSRLPAQLAQWAAAHAALLLHYSTDYVYGADKGQTPRCELDATAPLSVYGQSKLAGEEAIRAAGCSHVILRTQWVYAARGQNFLLTMLRLARSGRALHIVDDQTGAPTPASWIAAASVQIWQHWRCTGRSPLQGLYHLSAGGSCTWYDFATAIFAGALSRGLLTQAPEPGRTSTAAYAAPAPRPLWSVLDNQRIHHDFDLRLPSWERGLEQVLAELADAAHRSTPC